MPEDAAPSPVVTPAPAATPVTEPTLEQQLESLRQPPPDGPKPVAAPPASAETPPPSPAPSPALEAPSSVDLDKKLETIVDPSEPKEPTLTPAQQEILALVPDAQTAKTVTTLAQGYQNFTNAFASGDFETAEGMLATWNPDAHAAFEEHIYQKKVASGEWVDRWIAEKEGHAPVHNSIKSLQSQVQELRAQLAGRQRTETDTERRNAEQRNATALVNHLQGLFDKIEFSKADRRWVAADIYSRIGANAAVKQAINEGDPKAVNKIFKDAVRDYVQRDQAAAKGREQATTTAHKPLIQTTPVTPSSLPDNVDDVPSDKLEQWMDEQLTALKGQKR